MCGERKRDVRGYLQCVFALKVRGAAGRVSCDVKHLLLRWGWGAGRKFSDVKVVRRVVTLYRMAQEKGDPFLVSVPVTVVLVIKKHKVLYLHLKSNFVVIKVCWSPL